MEPRFQLSYSLTKKSYKQLLRSMPSQTLTTVFFILFSAYFLINGLIICLEKFHWTALVFFAFALLDLILFCLWKKEQKHLSYKTYAAQFLDADGSASLTFTDEQILLSAGENSRVYAYAQLEEAIELPACFQLIVDGKPLFLPKGCFTQEALLDFRLFLMPKVHAKGELTAQKELKWRRIFLCTALVTVILSMFLPHTTMQTHKAPKNSALAYAQHYYPRDQMTVLKTQHLPQGEISYIHNQTGNILSAYVWVPGKSGEITESSAFYSVETLAEQAEQQQKLLLFPMLGEKKDSLLSFGVLYADSALKAQIPVENLETVPFSANGKDYLLYFEKHTEVNA